MNRNKGAISKAMPKEKKKSEREGERECSLTAKRSHDQNHKVVFKLRLLFYQYSSWVRVVLFFFFPVLGYISSKLPASTVWGMFCSDSFLLNGIFTKNISKFQRYIAHSIQLIIYFFKITWTKSTKWLDKGWL